MGAGIFMLIFMKKHYKAVIIFLVMVMLIAVAAVFGYRRHIQNVIEQAYSVPLISTAQLEKAESSKADKLMIVAHPDDEVLWGGGHLYDGGYLVVCVTGGRNETRAGEFRCVIKASGNECIILDYPDKVNGKRDTWEQVSAGIRSDLEKIMTCKEWNTIAVHNQKGEYGHTHHINLHGYVTEIYDRDNIGGELYCFGRYYKKSRIEQVKDGIPKMTEERYNFKEKLAGMYTSQQKTISKLWHMAWYEDWALYERFSEHPEFANSAGNDLIGAVANETE